MKKRISVWQILALSFLIAITVGTLLLLLPISYTGEKVGFINALFTATSATCVTGLVVFDTATKWTLFGEIVILFLIQIGGLGFMTLVSVILTVLGKKLTLAQKVTFSQTTNFSDYTSFKDLVKGIVFGTLIAELIGATLLSTRFIPLFGGIKGIYYSVWHSVSAFCNAGFDILGGTLGGGQFISFTKFYNDPVIMITLSLLISSGGIGFCVLRDVFKSRFNFKKFQLHTKITITVNTILIIVSTALFMVFEHNYTYKGLNFFNRLYLSIFNAITPRTAGFSAIDYTNMSEASYLLNVFLMFIGGSSGSTAGGIKVGTLAIIIFGMRATFTGKKDITVFKKRIGYSQVSTALTIVVAYLSLIILSASLISVFEQNTYLNSGSLVSSKEIIFECVSALGTVGSSLSLTPLLTSYSKIILIILMYFGRVGIITIGLAVGKSNKVDDIKYPLDNIFIV